MRTIIKGELIDRRTLIETPMMHQSRVGSEPQKRVCKLVIIV